LTTTLLWEKSDINIGKFRDYDDMEVVSGPYEKEKVHYHAIPHKEIAKDIEKLLDYINHSKENPYIKSAFIF